MAKNRQMQLSDGSTVVFDDETETVNGTVSEELEAELSQSFGDADDTSEVILYKQDTKSHKDGMHICDKWSGDVITWSKIQETAREYADANRDTYFRVIIRKAGKIVQHKPFSIAGKKQQPAPVMAVKGDSETAHVLQAMLAMQERQNTVLAELMKPRDTMADMKDMLGLLAMMRQAMGEPQKGPDFSAIVQKSMESMSALFDMQLKMMDMHEVFGTHEPEKDDGVLGVVKELGPKLLEVVQGHQAVESIKAQGQALQATKPANATPPAIHAPKVDPTLKAIGDALLPHAQADADPVGVASQMMVLLPRDALGAFLSDKPLARLMAGYPPIRAHADWLADLVSALYDALEAVEVEHADNLSNNDHTERSSGSDAHA